jgi:hypothetical protein
MKDLQKLFAEFMDAHHGAVTSFEIFKAGFHQGKIKGVEMVRRIMEPVPGGNLDDLSAEELEQLNQDTKEFLDDQD